MERTDAEAEASSLWPSDGKPQLTEKDLEAGKDWGQVEKGTREDEMVGWQHRFNGNEFEPTPGDGKGQGSLVCCSPEGCKESDTNKQLNNNSLESQHWLHPGGRLMLCVTRPRLGRETTWLWGVRQVSFTWNTRKSYFTNKGLRIYFPVNSYWVHIMCQKLRPKSWEPKKTRTNVFCSGGTYSQWWHQVLLKPPSWQGVWNNTPGQLHFPPCCPAQLLTFLFSVQSCFATSLGSFQTDMCI